MKTATSHKPSPRPRDVDYYLSLPYAVEITPIAEKDGGGCAACIPLLGRWSAVGDGETAAEAYSNLRAALPSLIEHWLARGIAIPEPAASPTEGGRQPLLSGKLSLRLPRTLHTQAAQVAEHEGVSINQFIAAALAREIGARHAAEGG